MPKEEKLYLVCHDIQEKEIKEYCFGKCKKILMGAIQLKGLSWWPCRTEECLYSDDEAAIGTGILPYGTENIVIRKLKKTGGV